jgi:hypothetical protein
MADFKMKLLSKTGAEAKLLRYRVVILIQLGAHKANLPYQQGDRQLLSPALSVIFWERGGVVIQIYPKEQNE